jgi:ribosomal protein S18 acetylase RimI-like enzyme
MPPGENMDDYMTIFRSGMWRLTYQFSKEGKKRFFDEFLPLLNDTKANVLGERDDDSWYLVYLGTKPSGRGKGYARQVVEYVTRQADAEGKACYLESSNIVNRTIYRKLGFEMKKNIYLQRADEHVELDIMVREPLQARLAKGIEKL